MLPGLLGQLPPETKVEIVAGDVQDAEITVRVGIVNHMVVLARQKSVRIT